MKLQFTLIAVTIIWCVFSCGQDDPIVLLQAPQQGLVAHFPLDGNATDAVGSNTGSMSGVLATTGHSGDENSGVYFSGDGEYIEVPHNESFNFGFEENFTISVWARFNEQANTLVTTNSMISKWCLEGGSCAGESSPFALRVHNQTSDTPGAFLGIRRNTRSTSLCQENNWFSTNTVFDYDRYHHIVYVKDGRDLRIYVDGTLSIQEDDVVTNDCPIRNEAPLLLGVKSKQPSEGNLAFQGSLDELYIYDRALNEEEIEMLYLLE